MGLIELLRRIAQAARSRDARTMRTTLALASHYGWGREVMASLARMPAREAAFVGEVSSAMAEDARPARGSTGADYAASTALGAVSDPLAGVTRDATSLKYCPANATEWAAVCTVAGVSPPSFGWGMQDASAGAAATVGAVALTEEGARIDYGVTVTGWARKGIRTRGDGLQSSSASLPLVSASSMMVLSYAVYGAGVGAFGSLFAGTSLSYLGIDASRQIYAVNPAATESTHGSSAVGVTVHPQILQINRATSLIWATSDQDNVSVVIGTQVGRYLLFSGNTVANDGIHLLGAVWADTAAEMTTAQKKSLLQTLNWTIPWS